jgi:hypothetical protein
MISPFRTVCNQLASVLRQCGQPGAKCSSINSGTPNSRQAEMPLMIQGAGPSKLSNSATRQSITPYAMFQIWPSPAALKRFAGRLGLQAINSRLLRNYCRLTLW